MWCSPAVITLHFPLWKLHFVFSLPIWWREMSMQVGCFFLTTVKGFSLSSEGKQVGAVRMTALIWCTAWRHYWRVRLHYGSVQITNISVSLFFSLNYFYVFLLWFIFFNLCPYFHELVGMLMHTTGMPACIYNCLEGTSGKKHFSLRVHCQVLGSLNSF